MKKEPLKNKQRYYLDAVKIHHTIDVKSAVEWLKEELKKHRCRKQTGNWCLDFEIANAKSLGIDKALNKIDKAFPDLCPTGADNSSSKKDCLNEDCGYKIRNQCTCDISVYRKCKFKRCSPS